jgi:hypothetical protein
LTEATGLEHAVVRLNNGKRMLLRGNQDSISHILNMDVKMVVVHSHPGNSPYHLMPSGFAGDVGYLWRIGQKRSYIVTSHTNAPGIPYWLGEFDNQGYWRAINTPPMMPTGGNVLK